MKWGLWFLWGDSNQRERKKPWGEFPHSSLLSHPVCFLTLLQRSKKSSCVPGSRAAGGRCTVRCAPFRCANTWKYLSLLQPPLQGVLRNPLQCLLLCKLVEQAAVERSSHPFRQKYLLLKCRVCTRLNLFKEFAIIEACVCGFFPPRMESDLLKTEPFFSRYTGLRASQLVSAKKSLQKQTRDLQLEILMLLSH